ncbi:MAG: MFS transporter [Candidatus Bathyarchaeota archaeon]|nr:MFS transporter [Candidatus Bathyarchaeota archaeon]
MIEGTKEVLRRGVAIKRYLLYSSIERIPFYLNVIYIPLYAVAVKGADAYTLGGMATAALLVPLILAIPSGKLADRYGRKKVVYLCVLLFCISPLLLAVAPEGNSLLLIVAGVFQGFYMLGMVTGNAIRAEIVPISLLGSWGGILGFFGGIVGMIVPVTAGYIWSTVNPQGVLILIAGGALIGAAVLTTVPESLNMAREI